VRRLYNENNTSSSVNPCGGGFEYLHRDPASRRRRRKGKSYIWDTNIWSRVPRDSDLRKTTLARISSIYKRQTHPLVREAAPQKQDRNCQTVINIWSWAPDGARHQDLLIDWPSVVMWLSLRLWQLSSVPGRRQPREVRRRPVKTLCLIRRVHSCVIIGVIWSASSCVLIALPGED
jgi:hypothetical protein